MLDLSKLACFAVILFGMLRLKKSMPTGKMGLFKEHSFSDEEK
jgi:hypothetical protein